MHALVEARRAAPAVLYLPHLQLWWQTASASLRAILWMLLADLPPDLPLLLLAVADCNEEVPSLPPSLPLPREHPHPLGCPPHQRHRQRKIASPSARGRRP